MQEDHRAGLHYLEAVTTLLKRVRGAHPTKGLYEAADLQWWWRASRSTDDLGQLFWFDDLGRPEAAVIAVDWTDGIALVPIVMPDATPDWIGHVIERGIAHAAASGFGVVDLEVDRADEVMHEVLIGHDFAIVDGGPDTSAVSVSVVEAWLAAEDRPEISRLREDYRLFSRLDTMGRRHHMISTGRGHPDVEARLRQTSLYRPDLDLVILDRHDNPAAFGLFWYEPETSTGLVEPMRTEDGYQRRGLARHVLTAGVDLLAQAGAERIKIVYGPDNQAAKDLYLSVGFAPVKETVVFSGRAGARAS